MGINKKMKVLVALLLLTVSLEVLGKTRRLLKKHGRSLTLASMRCENKEYGLTLSNMQDRAVAGNMVVGWPWAGYNNQVWDVQLHPDNGAYNAAGVNQWTFRTMSGGGN